MLWVIVQLHEQEKREEFKDRLNDCNLLRPVYFNKLHTVIRHFDIWHLHVYSLKFAYLQFCCLEEFYILLKSFFFTMNVSWFHIMYIFVPFPWFFSPCLSPAKQISCFKMKAFVQILNFNILKSLLNLSLLVPWKQNIQQI